MSVHDALPDDIYKPVMFKPSLQQYDPYQIYDVVCIDESDDVVFKKFLGIQAYSITPIYSDFINIANIYK